MSFGANVDARKVRTHLLFLWPEFPLPEPGTRNRFILRTDGTLVLLTPSKPCVNNLHHEPGNPHAGVGNPPRRLSGTNGGRLRPGRGALSILARTASDRRGLHVSRLDVPFSGPHRRRDCRVPAHDRSG